MRRRLFITILTIGALLFASCEQEPVSNTPDGNYPIFRGYMQFGTDVSTRASLATDMHGKSFGVLGYHYSFTTDWGTAKSTAKPEEFYNLKVSCGADGGVCTYDLDNGTNGNQLRPWDPKYMYTFFAYYPYYDPVDQSGAKGITLSNAGKTDTPTLRYEYSWKGQTELPIYYPASNQEMFDLMTAEAIDEDGSSNVDLNFKHRLFAVEVLANNYNETLYEYEYDLTKPIWEYVVDEDGNPVIATDAKGNPIQEKDADGNLLYEVKRDANGNKVYKLDENGNKILIKDENQIINDLVVRVEGLAYHAMTIPLSMQPDEADIIYEGTPNENNNKLLVPLAPIDFQIQIKPVNVPAFNEGGNGIPTSVSKNGSDNGNGYLMFIPQGPHTDIGDKYFDHDYSLTFTVSWTGKDKSSHTDTVESSMDFVAGKLYQIIINYVGDGITIALIEAGAWDYKDVYHTFE